MKFVFSVRKIRWRLDKTLSNSPMKYMSMQNTSDILFTEKKIKLRSIELIVKQTLPLDNAMEQPNTFLTNIQFECSRSTEMKV